MQKKRLEMLHFSGRPCFSLSLNKYENKLLAKLIDFAPRSRARERATLPNKEKRRLERGKLYAGFQWIFKAAGSELSPQMDDVTSLF